MDMLGEITDENMIDQTHSDRGQTNKKAIQWNQL